MATPADVEVTMLLCDWAEAISGKLYIMGGGWSQIRPPERGATMALAVKMLIPWDSANTPHRVRATLLTQDGKEVRVNDQPVAADGKVEVGRPPGLPPGTPLEAPFVLRFTGLQLDPGSYTWQLRFDDVPAAKASFRVLPRTT